MLGVGFSVDSIAFAQSDGTYTEYKRGRGGQTAEVYGQAWERNERAATYLFEEGVSRFNERRYSEALTKFRAAAVADPEHPRLASYMIRASAESDRERWEKFNASEVAEIERLMRAGTAKSAQKRYSEAAELFRQVLSRDPGHLDAKTQLQRMEDAVKRPVTDPDGARRHYEAGLIAYAGGNLQAAKAELKLAAKLDKKHPKASMALVKVEREIEYTAEGKP